MHILCPSVASVYSPTYPPTIVVPLNIVETHQPKLVKLTTHFQKTVDKLLQKGNLNLVSINTSSWKEQFVDALQVSAGTTIIVSIVA